MITFGLLSILIYRKGNLCIHYKRQNVYNKSENVYIWHPFL